MELLFIRNLPLCIDGLTETCYISEEVFLIKLPSNVYGKVAIFWKILFSWCKAFFSFLKDIQLTQRWEKWQTWKCMSSKIINSLKLLNSGKQNLSFHDYSLNFLKIHLLKAVINWQAVSMSFDQVFNCKCLLWELRYTKEKNPSCKRKYIQCYFVVFYTNSLHFNPEI